MEQPNRPSWYRTERARLEADLDRALGDRFDPSLRAAIAAAPSAAPPPGHVAAVERVGWTLGGGALSRPARVVVAAEA